ncbi:endolytic transglycosylase MltG [Wenzhouxiangella sp. AB-CW3]|uniref:endolytic transglycosylase MltG n=1 Tax=Wenzhouxiangella sp. AB-CW3 TaxID=2771012 RepID=UPI001CC329A2|nr:endolytic transglycosylase MltG [Wenzhouxiangella sp. AB-CW3]
MRILQLILVLLLAGALSAGLWLVHDWQRFQNQPLNPEGDMVLWLAPGTSYGAMVRQLESLKVARHDWRWRLYGRLKAPQLKAGEYLIEPGTTVAGLIEQIERGEVRSHRLTIVEGWTFEQMRERLYADPRIRVTTRGVDESALMERLGCSGCYAEGRFLPETYFFVRGTTDLELMARAHRDMNRVLSEVWSGRALDLPLDEPDELLVLASIIERETGQASERARVAGVFVRRLETGMRLQTDPTVVYGLGDDFDGRIRRVHLRTDHPWNTYTRHGLPPTPIALPGRAALEAAAHPADGTSLYFVSRGDGTHQFSDTLAEHNAAVDRYIRGRR